MTLDDLLDELAERSYILHYLRQPTPSIWECCILHRLEQTANGYINALGYGQTTISAATAIEYAIESIEHDPSIETFQPTANAIDMPSAHFDIMSLIREPNQPALFKRRPI